MPRKILTAFGAIALCITFYACGKSNSSPSSPVTPPPPPPPPITPTVGTMNVNLAYTDPGFQYELIISEPSGKILLDTLATPPTAIVAALKTNDTLVDVTAIVNNGDGTYNAFAYRSINASTITRLSPTGFSSIAASLKAGATTFSKILYQNLPPGVLNYNLNQVLFTNFYNNSAGTITVDPPYNAVEVHYYNYPGNNAYLLIPSAGLYKLHMQENAIDTVDCTQMDTAISLTFDRPEPFTINPESYGFIAIPDTTDLTKVIGLSDYGLAAPSRPGVDLEYPNIPVQKYELGIGASNASNDVLSFNGYFSTFPQTLPFPKEADFNIAFHESDNFSVTFPGTKPACYYVSLTGTNISVVMYARPDSSTMHPISFLTNLKSKTLQGAMINTLAPKQFGLSNFNGTNYSAYWSTFMGPNEAKLITWSSALIKNLP